jgi:diphthamide synthase (EF-2-diphthine--ammonia ligase)
MMQLDAARLSAMLVHIPFPCPNDIYEREMGAVLAAAKIVGITHVVFGDLFLEDVRGYREARLAEIGMTPVFPLWGRPTAALAREMIEGGVEAHLVCIDLKALPSAFAGRRFDYGLINSLPPAVDPCGENGEFHSFVAAGPMLNRVIPISVGETIEREGFAYADLINRAS